MSDIKKWAIGVGLTALLSLATLFLHYQIRAQVESQLASAGIVKNDRIELMQKDIDANKERAENLKKESEKLDSKIERVVQILLED